MHTLPARLSRDRPGAGDRPGHRRVAACPALDVQLWVLAVAALAMFVGASVQGAVGFGAALLAAPVLALLDPRFVPAPVILAALVLNLLVMRREPGRHHWRETVWPILGLLPGSFAGAAVLAVATDRDGLGVLFGVLILASVALSASGLHPRRSPGVLVGAGAIGGFMQATVGAGGPPVALAYQDASGPDLRGGLSRYFLVSCVVSLGMLAVFGQLSWLDVEVGAAMVPGAVAGFAVSGRVKDHVDAGPVRLAVLALAALGGLTVFVKALW